jgi:uncharacterized membrane protein
MRAHTNGSNGHRDQLARGLGWLSIGLGVAGIVGPGRLARAAGLKGDGLDRAMLGGVGVREIIQGVGILTQPRPAPWVWSRVAGDAMDISFVGYDLATGRARDRGRGLTTLAALVGITVVDVVGALRLSGSSGTDRAGGKKVITVGRSPEECYRFWHDFENLPRFMWHLESVQVTGPSRSHWRARAPHGSVEWDAETVEDRPNELIAWRALPGSDVESSGYVRFRPAPGDRGTEVEVEIRYVPPAGAVGRAVAKLTGEEPLQQVGDDLRRFKQVLETGEVIVSDATVRGNGFPQRPARPPEESRRELAAAR